MATHLLIRVKKLTGKTSHDIGAVLHLNAMRMNFLEKDTTITPEGC